MSRTPQSGKPGSNPVTPTDGSTFRMNAGSTAPGQSLKSFTGTISIASGATVALETVATGKTLFITDIYISGNTATQFSANVQANAANIVCCFVKGDTGPVQLTGIESQPSAGSGTAVQIVFGTAAATTACWLISGFEQ